LIVDLLADHIDQNCEKRMGATQTQSPPHGSDKTFSRSLHRQPRPLGEKAGGFGSNKLQKPPYSRSQPLNLFPTPTRSLQQSSPTEEKDQQTGTHVSWTDTFRLIFATSYLIISFAILGLTLYLVLSDLSPFPPILIYTLAIICFSIVMFPTIILSGHRGLILFFGITVLLLLSTSSLATAFAMTPVGKCANADYATSHTLTGGSRVRCQMVQTQCALLWIGLRSDMDPRLTYRSGGVYSEFGFDLSRCYRCGSGGVEYPADTRNVSKNINI
jgi:hypothetical protein